MRSEQKRVLVLLGAVVLALGVMGARLYRLTVVEAAAWTSRAVAQSYVELPIFAPRGAIYDRDGRPLATSEPVYAALLYDQDPEHVAAILPKLSELLAEGDAALAEEISAYVMERVRLHQKWGRQAEDLVIRSGLSQETVAEFIERQNEFPGVTIVTQSVRRYPEGKVAGNVIGYVQPISEEQLESEAFRGYHPDSVVGKDGIELSYESYLQGKTGKRVKAVDPAGRPLGTVEEVDPEPGYDLTLTLDLDVQKAAEEALAANLKWIEAQNDPEARPIRASLVALDVKTGAVLAMAQIPSYDPNLFIKAMTVGLSAQEYEENVNIPGSPLINWSLQGFAPGSTYKMGVGLAGVSTGAIGPYETVHCSTTYFRDPTRKNWYPVDQGHLALDMALAQSCNPYFYEIGHRMGIDALAEYLKQFGFGQKTGIDLPFEDPGLLPTQASYGDRWQPGHVYSVAIGQGDVLVTPLQLAVYASTIANRGVRYQPYLVQEIRSSTGEVILKREPVVAGTVEAPDVAWQQVIEGMRKGGAHPLGTAYWVFRDFPIPVAVKTGSAETGKAYADAITVAFAPIDDPQIAVAVFVEGGAHGSWVSPSARAVFAAYFGIEDKGPARINKAD